MLYDLVVTFLIGGLAGWITAAVFNLTLTKRTYSLECDVADLQEKILSEIKKRASKSRQPDNFEQQLLEKIKESKPEPAQPWWVQYAAGPKG